MRESGVVLYITGGWRDDLRKDGFVAFNNWTPGKRHIVIGPWIHCRNEGLDLFAEMHRFFDFYLKDTPNGFENDAPIHYFTVNAPAGHEWHTASAWPLPQAKQTPFHLAGKSRLAPTPSGGETSFRVQYAVKCAAQFDAALQSGPFAQPCPVEAGPHFLSPVLKQDMEITGHPIADVWISADVTDVNLFVYLEDVAPDGSVTSITDGRQRASLRKVVPAPWEYMGLPWRRSNREDAQPLVLGTPARIQFDLLPVSYIVKAGHRVRVSVTGADYRERDPQAADPAPTITVHDSRENPSQILLPVVPGA
jgi:putative CocE/NonD family hydrolase